MLENKLKVTINYGFLPLTPVQLNLCLKIDCKIFFIITIQRTYIMC